MVLIILCVNIFNSNATQIVKTNTIIQGIYAFVTIVLVILTFNVLIVSKKQNYQSIKPDLTFGNIDLIDDHRNELDFEILNTGKGKAYNILIEIFKSKDKKPFYTESYPRLDTISSELIAPLYEIVNAIRDFKRETTNNQNGYSNVILEEMSISKELNLSEHYSKYYNIIFAIQFEDSYSNQYKNTFEMKYDEKESEYGLVKETSMEIENYILSIRNIFK